MGVAAAADSVYAERAYAAGREFVAGIEAILPGIAERAMETELLGRAPDANIQAMADAGMFRALVPVRHGGLEIDPASYMAGITQIGTACGSSGWIAGLVSVHAWQIALMAEQMQQEFWQDGPDARASSSYAPTGKVRTVEGGFMISGRWDFSSGVEHSRWAILGAVVRDAQEGPEFRSFVVPAHDFTIDEGSWQVMGLSGTGSKSITINGEAFVPDYRTHRLIDQHLGTDPGLTVNTGALYRISWISIFFCTIAAAAIGAASGGLNAFVRETASRVSPASGLPAVMNPYMHQRLADALLQVSTLRERTLQTWRQMFDVLCTGAAVPRLVRVRSRFEFADVTAGCYAALAGVFEIAGGNSINVHRPVQRFLRDLMAMRNHPTATREVFASVYAQAALGLVPNAFDKSSMGSLALHN